MQQVLQCPKCARELKVVDLGGTTTVIDITNGRVRVEVTEFAKCVECKVSYII